jgi:hypothetical protein
MTTSEAIKLGIKWLDRRWEALDQERKGYGELTASLMLEEQADIEEAVSLLKELDKEWGTDLVGTIRKVEESGDGAYSLTVEFDDATFSIMPVTLGDTDGVRPKVGDRFEFPGAST